MESYDVTEWGKPLQRALKETPRPQGSEVLVKLRYCGVCHSDVHIREGVMDLGGGKKIVLGERGYKLPLTLGHEAFGTVVSGGPDAGTVPVGSDVVVYPWIGCGTCARCTEGNENVCMAPRNLGLHRAGGFADHLIVAHPRYLVDAAGLDPAYAATLACSGLTAYSAARKLAPIPAGEWVLVIGAGGLGLSVIAMLRAMGHDKIACADVDAAKLAAATAAGATAVIDSSGDGAIKQAQQALAGPIYGAVDLVGTGATAQLALALFRRGGRYVGVGLYGGELPFSISAMIQRALTLQGSIVGTLTELREVIALAQSGKLKPIPVTTRPLSAAGQTLDDLAGGRITGRVVLDMAAA